MLYTSFHLSVNSETSCWLMQIAERRLHRNRIASACGQHNASVSVLNPWPLPYA
uniref:hypothetical protein n=1 Tax=Mycolicibacterium sp. CBMA 213 TaxID=1968788 RepID=UPI00155D9A31|nr:hypothetical protein [Mycolicibacterium sp. CBMA 213]